MVGRNEISKQGKMRIWGQPGEGKDEIVERQIQGEVICSLQVFVGSSL